MRDVLSVSLGIHVKGGVMSVVIGRNTPIPVEVTKRYYTLEDNQTVISVRAFQGERPLVADCAFLTEFSISGIKALPAGADACQCHTRLPCVDACL
jgi:molecular chaperone DnaK